MNNTFDCVEMKRRGAEALRAKLEGMPREEELAFWHEEDRRLLERQARLRSELQAAADPNAPGRTSPTDG